MQEKGKKSRYNGIDPSGNWKVVNNEGQTLTLVDEKGNRKVLDSFKGYRFAAPYAAQVGGTPVRE